MKNEHAEQLLQQLIDGQMSPAEFKTLATAPRVVACLVFEPSGPGGDVAPEDAADLVVDDRKKQVPYSEYLAIRERYPDATYVTPIVFSP